jgi:branched-chain amino acid transport system permease protein
MTTLKNSKGFWLSIVLALIFFGIMQYTISNGILNPFYINTLMFIGINIMLATSLHLIIGITGQFSIGHAGFLAVGAYASAVMTMKLELPFIIAVLARGRHRCCCCGMVIGMQPCLGGLPGDSHLWFEIVRSVL